jgi:excisionase family DNA binding protein
MSNDLQLAMSIDEAARRIGICRDRLYTEIKEGRLEAKRCGRRRTLITTAEIQRYLAALPPLKLPPAA